MGRVSTRIGLVAMAAMLCSTTVSAALQGHYLEARTCQVYTGPCFANGEMGLTGKDAVMSWRISEGDFQGVDLSGLAVTVIIRATDTLGFFGLEDARDLKSMIVVDQRADATQREALVAFAKSQIGRAAQNVAAVTVAPIELQLDEVEVTGVLHVGNYVELKTRKARPGDCICSNESAFYPPLAKLEGSVPGVTIEGEIHARKLGRQWSIPDTRTAYLGTFIYE